MNSEIGIKRLKDSDVQLFEKLVLLLHDVFEMEDQLSIDQAHLQKLLKEPSFIVFVAIKENEIVGGLTAYELPMYYGKYSEVFIYDIGVGSEFQRMGIGKLLISSLQAYCKEKGIREMFVAAHEEDQHALDFYRSTGGKAEKVVHFNYLLE